MEIINARLKGFIGFKKGMGLDEVSVDMSRLSGLVALAGPNGKGKTTLLENLQPFREIASRKGALYHHVFLRDSEKDLTFRYAGDEYRTLIKIDAQSERQEGFIWKNGVSEVNGKVSEYDNYITRLLGSSALFFNSVFCAQNSAKISDLRPGELKALFSEFLRLDRYVKWEDTAKQAGNLLSAQHRSLMVETEALATKINELSGCDLSLKDKRLMHETIQDIIKARTDDLEDKDKELAILKEQINKNTIFTSQILSLQGQIKETDETIKDVESKASEEMTGYRQKAAEIIVEIKTSEELLLSKESAVKASAQKQQLENLLKSKRVLLESTQNELAAFNKKVTESSNCYRSIQDEIKDLQNDPEKSRLVNEIATEEATYSAKSQSLKTNIEKNEKILLEKEAILTASERKQQLEALFKDKKISKEALRNDLVGFNESLAVHSNKHRIIQDEINYLQNNPELTGLKNKVDLLKDRAENLNNRDPECSSTICSFIVAALDAQNKLPDTEKIIKEKESEIRRNLERKTAYILQVKASVDQAERDLNTTSVSISELSNEIDSIDQEIENLKTLSEKAISIKDAEASLAEQKEILCYLEAENKIPALQENLKSIEDALDKKIEEKLTASLEAKQELEHAEKALSTATETISELNKEIKTIETELEALKALAEKLPKIEAAETRIKDLQKRKEELIKEGTEAKDRWDKIRIGHCDRLVTAEEQIKELEAQIDKEAEEKAEGIRLSIPEIESSLKLAKETSETVLKDIYSIEQKVIELDKYEKQMEGLREKLSEYALKTSYCKYLQDACGKNGLQALEIDSVAPVITGYANDYTLSAFGPNSALKIRTLGDEGKECFDILIIDEDGEEVALGNRSGGQKVWPLKALRLAMSNINRDKSGRDFKTILADEEDGALDTEKAISFVKLYRSFLNQSDFNTCCYISHKKECVDMADHILTFNGGIRVD